MGPESTEAAVGAAEKRQFRLFDDLRKRNQRRARRARGEQPISVPELTPLTPPTTAFAPDGVSDPNSPG
jgi:hypothetical protein